MDPNRGKSHDYGPGPIPKRWLQCPRTSESIITDKFLAFKTPLSSRFASQVPIENKFEPEIVFSLMKMYKVMSRAIFGRERDRDGNLLQVKMGMWVDLTNTKRFYDRREVESRDCRYTKLQCRGHGETPSPEQTQSFIEIVDQFITENPMQAIGVHCTHGFNRTGFLIVCYMVERMDCSVEAALAAFAHARPPGIYKADYIKELFRRYDDEDDAPPPPELPQWCNEEEEDDAQYDNYYQQPTRNSGDKRHANDGENDAEANGECSTGANGENGPKKKRKKETVNPNATFMTGVPGVVLVTDQVSDACGLAPSLGCYL